ncbi:polysaccharide deacetylase family protein [Amphibacillus sp. Q70]|uniref:polysaccharide deacetylase family protein n=1 Tax=Amphibacillus sp. Q70 TaxID=3453416 RepID=UPI003F825960
MKWRKLMIILSFFLIFILLGCQEQAEEPNHDEETEVNEDDQESDYEDPEQDTDDSTETDLDENIDEQEDEETEPLYQINQTSWRVEPISDETNSKVALLTIDDAVDENALDMAHTLKELDAPAIFFVNGHFIETDEKQEMLKEIHEMGFAIGNHTYTHPNLQEISEDEQRKEIVELNDLIEEIIGERPKFFRAPHGANTDFSFEIVEQEEMVPMNWTYGYDWEADYMDSEALADIMVNTEYLTDGANLLMHDRDWTAGALEDIVTGLRDKDYELVDPHLIQTISE